ncbi:hypothetical protein ACFPL7_05200 [Dongia soli]
MAAPVNWQPGKPAIIAPSLTNQQAREHFPQGWTELKPYLRIVQP